MELAEVYAGVSKRNISFVASCLGKKEGLALLAKVFKDTDPDTARFYAPRLVSVCLRNGAKTDLILSIVKDMMPTIYSSTEIAADPLKWHQDFCREIMDSRRTASPQLLEKIDEILSRGADLISAAYPGRRNSPKLSVQSLDYI